MELNRPKDIIFDELTHSYLDVRSNTLLTGITTMMAHQGLAPVYDGISEEMLMDAAKRGTYVHNMYEDYDNGLVTIPCDVVSDYDESRVLLTSEDAKKLLNAYKKLRLDILHSEFLVSDGKTVASFIDKVIATDSTNVVDLGDVKTSSTFHTESVSWQLSFYAYLLELSNPEVNVGKLYGIHARNGKVKLIEVPRKDPELCRQYIEAEARGEVFHNEEEMPSADLALSKAELSQYLEYESALAQYDVFLKTIKSMHDELKAKLYEYMLTNNIEEMSTDRGIIKLKRPYTTERLDSSKLKKEHPDLAEKYTKVSEVKGSITFKP